MKPVSFWEGMSPLVVSLNESQPGFQTTEYPLEMRGLVDGGACLGWRERGKGGLTLRSKAMRSRARRPPGRSRDQEGQAAAWLPDLVAPSPLNAFACFAFCFPEIDVSEEMCCGLFLGVM